MSGLALLLLLCGATWLAGAWAKSNLARRHPPRGELVDVAGMSEAENQPAWQAWQELQSELATLSSNSEQVTAEKSGHNIHLQQPQLVTEATRQIVQVSHR